MKKKTGIDPSYYENNCFADEFREADRKGELLRPHDGKNAIEVMREHIAAKKNKPFGIVGFLPNNCVEKPTQKKSSLVLAK